MELAKDKNTFSLKENKKVIIFSFLLTFFVCVLSYNAFINNIIVSPDGILEGLHTYINKNWAISGCGRWSLVLINMLHLNTVFSWLTIMECIIVNWLSAHLINRIIDTKNKYLYCISCVLFSIIPPIIASYTYTNVSLAFCLSILLCILFVYFNLKRNNYFSMLSGICLGFAMGLYQAQLGVAVSLTIICIIKNNINNENNTKYIIRSFISGIIAVVVYVLGLYICLKIYDLELIQRVASFSISNIISNFPSRFIEVYKVFFSTFLDIKLKRNYIYLLLIIIFIIEFVYLLMQLIKDKRYTSLLCNIILVALLPLFINIVGIIIPYSEITFLMLVPEYIILFFLIYLIDNSSINFNSAITYVSLTLFLILSWTFVISANATYDSYKMSYNVYKQQFTSSLDKVYELDEFNVNITRIVVIGRPSDKVLRDNISTYKYAENLYENLLYWNDPHLDPITTYQYLLNEFGIDGGIMEYEEYIEFVNKDECINMPSYPNKGYVQMIDGCAVIKFNNIYE